MDELSKSPLERACEIVGSQAALAKALGVTPAVINQWLKGRRPIPPRHCPEIEGLTSGEVRCEDLCPEVDWAAIRSSNQQGPNRRSTDPEPPSAPDRPGRQPIDPKNTMTASTEQPALYKRKNTPPV